MRSDFSLKSLETASHQLEVDYYYCDTWQAGLVKVASACSADQFSSWSYRWSVGHVSRGAQKAKTTSEQSPRTASVCMGLIKLGSFDCVPRNNDGVEADKRFSRRPRSYDNEHLVL